MEYKITVTDENGNEHLYNVSHSSSDEKNSLNDFILRALEISEDKRKLPFYIYTPNGMEVFPSIKMGIDPNEGFGAEIKAMIVSWRN